MSMSTSCIYGIGFNCEVTNEVLKKFFLSHKKSLKEINEGEEILAFAESSEVPDFISEYSEYDNETNGECGIYGAVADIMGKETGIDFEYRNSSYQEDSYDLEHAILFPECYPWQFNEIERNLSRNDLTEILTKYMKELGISEEPDFVSMKYFG